MAFGDEQVVINVRDVDHGEIEYTNNAGAKHTYYPCRSNWLEVEDLEVTIALADPIESKESELVTRVRGTARLEDRSLSVVGDLASKTKNLTISFEAGSWRPTVPQPDPMDFHSSCAQLGGAMLSFIGPTGKSVVIASGGVLAICQRHLSKPWSLLLRQAS
jgi:hypothetical protein